jgi:putative Holliday junction resolvase
MPENDTIKIEDIELDTLETVKASIGKILAVDFGDARTGLAVSDASRFLASGIGYVAPGGIEKTAEAVAAVAKEQRAVAVVVGLPVNMDGSEGSRAARYRKFAALLKAQCALPVAMFDERMTTMTASRYLNETNTRGKKRKTVIDTLSAQIILQNCLDRLKYMN